MGRGDALRQVLEAPAGDRHHLPRGAADLRSRLASGAAATIHRQSRRRRRDHRERRRGPQDRRGRSAAGRGHHRQGAPVEGARRQNPTLYFRPHRLTENPMKLLYFDDWKLGVLKGDRVVDVSPWVADIPHTGPGDLINGLIARYDQYRGRLEDAAAIAEGVA